MKKEQIITQAISKRKSLKMSELSAQQSEFKVAVKALFKTQLGKAESKATPDELLGAMTNTALAIKVATFNQCPIAEQLDIFPAIFRTTIEKIASGMNNTSFASLVEAFFSDFDESLLVQDAPKKERKASNRIDGVLKLKRDEGRTSEGVEYTANYELSKLLVGLTTFNDFCKAWDKVKKAAQGKKIALFHRASNTTFTTFALRTPNLVWKDQETEKMRRLFISRIGQWSVVDKKSFKGEVTDEITSGNLTEQLVNCADMDSLSAFIAKIKKSGKHIIARTSNAVVLDLEATWQAPVMFFQDDEGNNSARCTIENLMTCAAVVEIK